MLCTRALQLTILHFWENREDGDDEGENEEQAEDEGVVMATGATVVDEHEHHSDEGAPEHETGAEHEQDEPALVVTVLHSTNPVNKYSSQTRGNKKRPESASHVGFF